MTIGLFLGCHESWSWSGSQKAQLIQLAVASDTDNTGEKKTTPLSLVSILLQKIRRNFSLITGKCVCKGCNYKSTDEHG